MGSNCLHIRVIDVALLSIDIIDAIAGMDGNGRSLHLVLSLFAIVVDGTRERRWFDVTEYAMACLFSDEIVYFRLQPRAHSSG
jgi:hypothetical protein